MGLIAFLEKRIAELEQNKADAEKALVEIHANIERADAKKRQESDAETFHKWNQIMKALEAKLDRARAVITQCEAELQEKRERLRQARENAEAEPEPEEPSAQPSGEIVDRIMSMSVEDLGSLSMEDIARLQELELAQSAPPASAKKPEPPKRRPITPEERKRQRELQDAIEKLLRNEAEALTLREAEILLECYIERAGEGSGDRIIQLLRKELAGIADRCRRLHEGWKGIST